MIRFTVIGQPEPAGSKRGFSVGGKVRIVDANRKAAPWKQAVACAGWDAMEGRQPITGPVEASFTFYRVRSAGHYGTGRNAGKLKASAPTAPYTRPDVLKLTRGAEDALSGICYRDDAQIVSERLDKRWGRPARVEIEISEWTVDSPGDED